MNYIFNIAANLQVLATEQVQNVQEVVDEVSSTFKEKTDQTVSWFATWWSEAKGGLVDFAVSLVIAIIVLIIGKKLIQWALYLLKRTFQRSNMDEAVSNFLLTITRITLRVLVLVIAMGIVGIQTSSLVALVGSAGLALGLALQGSLSNFAGGVLILLMKPFHLGDYIVAMGNEGTVTHIDIFYTRLLTVDNKLIVIPNGSLSAASIVNVTNEPTRRLDLSIGIDYSEDVDKVKDILRSIARSETRLLEDKDIDIFISSFDASSITIAFRMWLKKEDYWDVKWHMHDQIKKEFDKHQVVIPFDQLDVNIKQEA